MKIVVPEKLKILSSLFTLNGTPLYIVGGYVRNAILEIYNTDIDLASALKSGDVQKLLEGTQFLVREQSKKMGTVKIFTLDKSFECEYTPFRSDEYAVGGAHKPISVSFNADIYADAKRRDFTCNALYYDIYKDKILDFYNGEKHTREKLLKVIHDDVFLSDGLRLLRLIRQSAELNFKIDTHTFELATSSISQLKDISKDRIRVELEYMLIADQKYGAGNYILGFQNLLKLGALKYITGTDTIKFKLLNHAEPISRLPALLIDMGIKSENANDILGINGLKFSSRIIGQTELVLRGYYELTSRVKSAIDTRLLIQKYNSIYKILVGLNYKSKQLEMSYNYMKAKKIPLALSSLAINGLEVIRGFPDLSVSKIGLVLNNLLAYTATSGNLNTKNILIKKINTDVKGGKYL